MTKNFLRFECFTKHLLSVKKLTKNVGYSTIFVPLNLRVYPQKVILEVEP